MKNDWPYSVLSVWNVMCQSNIGRHSLSSVYTYKQITRERKKRIEQKSKLLIVWQPNSHNNRALSQASAPPAAALSRSARYRSLQCKTIWAHKRAWAKNKCTVFVVHSAANGHCNWYEPTTHRTRTELNEKEKNGIIANRRSVCRCRRRLSSYKAMVKCIFSAQRRLYSPLPYHHCARCWMQMQSPYGDFQ